MTYNLFPPFLDPYSDGAAVLALHAELRKLGYEVEPHSTYDAATVVVVKQLQQDLGFTGDDVDGKCGPGTRSALREQRGVDLDAIPLPQDSSPRETYWRGPNHRGTRLWPPAE